MVDDRRYVAPSTSRSRALTAPWCDAGSVGKAYYKLVTQRHAETRASRSPSATSTSCSLFSCVEEARISPRGGAARRDRQLPSRTFVRGWTPPRDPRHAVRSARGPVISPRRHSGSPSGGRRRHLHSAPLLASRVAANKARCRLVVVPARVGRAGAQAAGRRRRLSAGMATSSFTATGASARGRGRCRARAGAAARLASVHHRAEAIFMMRQSLKTPSAGSGSRLRGRGRFFRAVIWPRRGNGWK